METIKVIYRKYKSDGQIVALFPYMYHHDKNRVGCYQRFGQHSECDYNHMINITVLADDEEKQDLKLELEGIYDDVILKEVKKKM